jgi:hypothetical protein
MVEPDPNKFHDHLDVCSQCRNQPLNLCPIGFAFLKEEALKESRSASSSVCGAGGLPELKLICFHHSCWEDVDVE